MDLLKDHQTGQDETQLQSFVLGGRTPWGTYKQALRELYKRVRGLRQMQTDIDLLRLDIEELTLEVDDGGIEAKRAYVNLRQKHGQLEEANRGLADLKREATVFWREANRLKAVIGEVTPERRVELDREEWRHWHVKQGMIGKLTTGRLPDVVLKNLCSITTEERREWLLLLQGDPEKFIEDGEYGAMALPPPSDDDVLMLEREIGLIEGDDE
jgi:hypothetical protein